MAEKVKENSEETKIDEELSGLNIKIRKKELTWIIGVMVFLIVVLFLTFYLSQSVNTFTYDTLKFEKQLYGEVPVYVYGYTFKDITGSAVQEYRYQLLLRLDPRKNEIPVTGEITLNTYGRDLYISVNTTGFDLCSTTSRDLATLSGFLTANLFDVHGGVPDKEAAREANATYITCEEYPQKTVLTIQTGEQSEIRKIADSCYQLTIANCETVNVIEKLEVQSLIDAKKRK